MPPPAVHMTSRSDQGGPVSERELTACAVRGLPRFVGRMSGVGLHVRSDPRGSSDSHGRSGLSEN